MAKIVTWNVSSSLQLFIEKNYASHFILIEVIELIVLWFLFKNIYSVVILAFNITKA